MRRQGQRWGCKRASEHGAALEQIDDKIDKVDIVQREWSGARCAVRIAFSSRWLAGWLVGWLAGPGGLCYGAHWHLSPEETKVRDANFHRSMLDCWASPAV